MAYQVIARRWRPQSFDEVVFQEHISKTIRNSIENGRISHAYLFAGPRGVGKTTSARILAKSLNCVNGPTANPCGVCENCVEIKEGRSFDVIEIDGASNNSVDDIRDLREKVNFSPVKGKYKIYIIDEVHMLSGSAFNALLKTLEEPPAHVVFIFATTEIHKLPETILSRCQKYFFRKIPVPDVAAHLAKIVKADGFEAEEGALYAIARAGGGSMRDAQSLLEQVLSFTKEKVTEHDALSQLGIVPLQSYVRIFTHIAGNNSKGIIDEVETVSSAGADLSRYAGGISNVVRALRLIREGVFIRESAGYSEDEMSALSSIAGSFHDEELSAFYRIAVTLSGDIRFVPNERACIEMALLDMLSVKRKPSLSAILAKLDAAKTAPPQHLSGIAQTMMNQQPFQAAKPVQGSSSERSSAPASGSPAQEEPSAAEEPEPAGRITVPSAIERAPAVPPTPDPADAPGDSPADDEPPLPEDEEIQGKVDYSEYEKEHPVVEKLVELFHGEVLKKGE
jgi:DNA polymerase-3 subunit gamma/tau